MCRHRRQTVASDGGAFETGGARYAIVTAQVRCRWGIAACRAQADLTIRRITWVGAPREGPRRHAGATAAELEAVEAICLDHLEGGGVHGGPEWARTRSD